MSDMNVRPAAGSVWQRIRRSCFSFKFEMCPTFAVTVTVNSLTFNSRECHIISSLFKYQK